MKKYILFSLILASLSYAANVEGEIKVGVDATIGLDGLSDIKTEYKPLFKLALPRENTFDEDVKQIPPARFIEGLGIKSAEEEIQQPIYVKDENEKNTKLGLRYASRAVQIDTTLLDANLKFKDLGMKVGVVIKSRPFKLGQGHRITDINRAYAYLNVNNDYLKLDSKFHIKGNNKETIGLNKFSENGYSQGKVDNQLDLDANVNPIKFYVSPTFGINYSGTLKNAFDYKIKPGLAFNILDNENNKLFIRTSYVYSKNNNDYIINSLENTIKSFTPGNRKVEYYKNWEIGELVLDTEYNKDRTIEGKDGKAAYRYIGTRDIKKGHLSGINGTIRAIGTPTGALYGDRLTTLVIKEGSKRFFEALDNEPSLDHAGETIQRILRKGVVDARDLWVGNLIKKIKLLNGIPTISGVASNKEFQEGMVKYVVDLLGIKQKGQNEVSDFYFTHLIPREYRKDIGDIFIDIPYEDSKANIEYRNKYPNDTEIIVQNVEVENNKTFEETNNKTFEEDNNKIVKFGSTRKEKNKLSILDDANNSIVNNGINETFIDDVDKVVDAINKGIGSVILSALRGEVNRLNNYLGEGKLFNVLVYDSDNSPLLDMFAGVQINRSESEELSKEYLRVLKDEYLIGDFQSLNQDRYNRVNEKSKNSHGFELELNYRNKKFPLNLTLNYEYGKSTASSSGKRVLVGKEARNKSLGDYFLILRQPNGQKFEKMISDSDITGNYRNGLDMRTLVLSTTNEFLSNETIVNNDMKFNLNYDGDKLKVNTGVNLGVDNIEYISKNKEKIHYNTVTWRWIIASNWAKDENKYVDYNGIFDTEIKYNRISINPYFDISYLARPTSWLEFNPRFMYSGNYILNQYKGIKGAKYEEGDEGENTELKEIKIWAFQRDDNNNLLKLEIARPTGDEYYDNLKGGESVDISKISKYAIGDEPSLNFKQELQGGKSKWIELESAVAVGLDTYLVFGNKFRIGYHLLVPAIFKGEKFDGFFVRNGLSLSYKF